MGHLGLPLSNPRFEKDGRYSKCLPIALPELGRLEDGPYEAAESSPLSREIQP